MGTNYYWLFDKEVLADPSVIEGKDHVPDIVKKVYRDAHDAQVELKSEHCADPFKLQREDPFIVPDYCTYRCNPVIGGLHIGKSSYGWIFGLHVFPDLGLNTYEDWEKLLPYGKIRDEYMEPHTCYQFVEMLYDKVNRAKKQPPREENTLSPNDSFVCPESNLFRRKGHDFIVNNTHPLCDYLTGYFS